MNLGDFRVVFQHNSTETGSVPGTNGSATFRGTTTCIVENDNEEVIGQSVARCSSKDLFTKRQGRKVSLTKAIADLPKAVRTQIWNDYWLAIAPPQPLVEA